MKSFSRPAPIEPAVFLLSTAVLAFEILLLRLFAIEHFHHFANMAIGMAMLGFGASGTALVLLRRQIRGRERAWFEVAAVLFTVTLACAIPLAHGVAFDPTRIPWDVAQWRALALVYASLALPFALGASALALALMGSPRRVGRVYAANLLGSATGSLLALALVALLRPERALAATSIPAAAGAALALLGRADSRALLRRRARPLVAFAVVALVAATTIWPPWQPEVDGRSRLVGERWSALGWAAATRAPAFRYAPGLSLAFTGKLPKQIALFVDGANAGAATDWRGDTTSLAFLRWLPSAAAYSAATPDTVLVLGSADGLEVLSALLHGAKRVTAVELNVPLAHLADAVLPPESRVYADPRVRLVSGDARTFTARSRSLYDLVVLPLAGGTDGATSALHGLGEDYLNTVEAYAGYLAKLAPDGMLAITCWIDAPPREATRTLLTVAAALRSRGATDVGSSIVFLRGWASATLLVKPSGFGPGEVERIAAFANERLFDIDWAPGGTPVIDLRAPLSGAPDMWPAHPGDELNPIRPVLAEAARAVAQSAAEAEAFARTYPFDVAPATDDRPYVGSFLRMGSLTTLLRQPRGGTMPSAEWGYLALIATLFQSTAIAALLTLVPALVLLRRPDGWGRVARFADPGTLRLAPMLRVAVYFGSIGAAYLLVEIAVIQKLTLLLGHPVYAAAAVLALFLALSGAGSLWSDRLPMTRARTAALVVAVIAAALALAFDHSDVVQAMSFPARVAVSLLVLAPLAIAMGLPFPLGVRSHARGHAALAWAWAVNGFASVIAASLAALIAMESGTRVLLLVGAGLYVVAALVVSTHRSNRRFGIVH